MQAFARQPLENSIIGAKLRTSTLLVVQASVPCRVHPGVDRRGPVQISCLYSVPPESCNHGLSSYC